MSGSRDEATGPGVPLRPELAGMKPYEPGKPAAELKREYDLDVDPVKLASNENPYPPPEPLRTVLSDQFDSLNRYPDGGAYYLRERLSEHYDWPADGIVIGAGSDEVLDFLAKATLSPGDEVIVSKPSFVRHGMVASMMGAKPVEVPLLDGFDLDLPAMTRAVTDRTRWVCVPNPNNPTSRYVDAGSLESFLDELPAQTLVLLDEAYFEFMDPPDYPDGFEILTSGDLDAEPVVLRTFSKAYGLAGLRVGYGLMNPSLARELHKVRPPFNVSRPAQALARRALDQGDHVRRCAERIRSERRRLVDELKERGYGVVPPSANFMLVDVSTRSSGEDFFEDLLRRGVIVRPMGPYGLPGHVRVTVGTPEENDRFLEALDELS